VRIAFDVSPLSHTPLGIGNYIRGSLSGLVEVAGAEHEVVAFAPTSLRGPGRIRAALADIPVETRLWPLPASHAIRTVWSWARHPAAERLLGRFDVLHFSDWVYPPQASGVRSTMIHDLVPLHHPEWCTARTVSMHSRKFENAARTCDVFFVNSAYTGRDVETTLGVSPEKIHVACPGVRAPFGADGEAADLGAPYILTVATLEPRKNLGTLLEAHALLGGDLLLAVVGSEGWGEQPELDRPSVRRLGFVSDEELARLYRGAAVSVYPSRFEGFGIPVVESMACGCPVVASAHPSLDDASGDAAVRADPDDAKAIASAIEDAVAQRDELAARGLAHAARFTWRAVGETFLRAFDRAVRRHEVMVVVHRPGPEFLVLRRSAERGGYWNLPAGGVEGGESAGEAASRELLEETGLGTPLSELGLELGYAKDAGWVRLYAFSTEAPAGWEPQLDDEHVERRWCSAREAVDLLAYPEPREAVREVARRLGAGA
jgi:glycosyltransferase involved in cell wall biosynthesis